MAKILGKKHPKESICHSDKHSTMKSRVGLKCIRPIIRLAIHNELCDFYLEITKSSVVYTRKFRFTTRSNPSNER